MNASALIRARVVVEDPHQQWRLDRAWTQRVDPDALTRELHCELSAHREDGALRCGVCDLRCRCTDQRDERRHVYHRTTARTQQVGDAVLATEIDATSIHRL